MNFKNKIVVITGASSGIGYALSAELIAVGAKVYSISRSLPQIPVEGVIYLRADLTKEEEVIASVAQIPEMVDLLVNNAGMMKRGHFWEISAEEFDQVWAIDVKGMWLMFKHLKDKLSNGAMTVQINSKNSRLLKADTFIYSLSKLSDLEIDKFVAKARPDLVMKVAYFGPVDTPLEWADYNDEQKAKKMMVALNKEQAAKLTMDLINSDKPNLIYLEEENRYEILD